MLVLAQAADALVLAIGAGSLISVVSLVFVLVLGLIV
jgi:hypothetical protein